MAVENLLEQLRDHKQQLSELRQAVRETDRNLLRLEGRVANLEQWREGMEARARSVPGWLISALMAVTGIVTLLVNLWLSGGRPPTP